MSDFERDYEIAYHWSPTTRRASIERDGLLIGSHPVVCDHGNAWISVSPTAIQAWWLSGGAGSNGGIPRESLEWDLYEVNIKGLRCDRRGDDYPELRVHNDISPDRVRWVGRRRCDPAVATPCRGPVPHSARWINTVLDRIHAADELWRPA